MSLTLSRHFSLSFIASGRSSGQHPVSSHSCWMYVRAGRPAFARPCVGVHKSTSLLSSSLLLQQCPACLVRLTWIVFVIGGRWPYSWCLVGCCRQDLFKIARRRKIMQRSIITFVYNQIIRNRKHFDVNLSIISLDLTGKESGIGSRIDYGFFVDNPTWKIFRSYFDLLELICLHTVTGFQVFLSNNDNSIWY